MAQWRRVLVIGAVGVVLAAAFPENRERRQAEPEPAPALADGAEGGAEAEAEEEPNPLGLPANASALLPGGGPPDDSFSCTDRGYGYFADPANACRVFHVCLPQQLPGEATPVEHRFSFVCPEQTQFNQEAFTCTRPEDSIPCDESPQWYHLNDRLGRTETPSTGNEESETNTNVL